MDHPIRILHLEDNKYDAILIKDELERGGIRCEITNVLHREDYTRLLESEQFDLVISDYTLPGMDGLTALEIAKSTAPEIPFIFVSGTIGEEMAVESLKHGALDYVIKDRLTRLVPAVRRAMKEEALRRERRQYDKKLREQAALLDKAQDAIVVLDLDHRVTYWNKGAEQVYEWPTPGALGNNFDTFVSIEKNALLNDAYTRVMKNGEWMGECRHRTRTGREVIVQSRWSLVRDDGGNPQSILMINTDMTASKKLEALFLRAQRMENLGTLAGGIAHDLNNILGPILLAVQVIAKRLTDPDSKRLLRTLEESAKRGADMVRQILGFARGASGEHVPLMIKHLLLEVQRMIEETFPPTIAIQGDIENRLSSVMGDATQLHQVLINLCVNARDSMPQGGTLTVTAKNTAIDSYFAGLHEAAPGPYVEVTISDTGVGMDAEVRERIFEPFFTTKEFGKGTGLGLSTALGIVKSHNGFFDVRSAPGKGTSFALYLPAVESLPEVKEGARQAQIEGHGELILVIDDEEPILDITKTTLEGCGFRVQTARDGTDGVAVFAQHQDEVELIIIDMVMPFMDGPSTIKAIQKLRPDARFIAVSGLEEYSSIVQVGGNTVSFLQKPYTMEKLLEIMEEALSAS